MDGWWSLIPRGRRCVTPRSVSTHMQSRALSPVDFIGDVCLASPFASRTPLGFVGGAETQKLLHTFVKSLYIVITITTLVKHCCVVTVP